MRRRPGRGSLKPRPAGRRARSTRSLGSGGQRSRGLSLLEHQAPPLGAVLGRPAAPGVSAGARTRARSPGQPSVPASSVDVSATSPHALTSAARGRSAISSAPVAQAEPTARPTAAGRREYRRPVQRRDCRRQECAFAQPGRKVIFSCRRIAGVRRRQARRGWWRRILHGFARRQLQAWRRRASEQVGVDTPAVSSRASSQAADAAGAA